MGTSDALAQLIEFNLASYEKMSGLKKKPQGELDRLEAVLKPIFKSTVAADLDAAVWAGTALRDAPLDYPRLSEIFQERKANNWSPLEALHGFFLKHRYAT